MNRSSVIWDKLHSMKWLKAGHLWILCSIEYGGKGENIHSLFEDATHVLTVRPYNIYEIWSALPGEYEEWVTVGCRDILMLEDWLFRPQNGGSTLLWNIGIHIPSHTASKRSKKAIFSKSFVSAALTMRLAVLGLILLTSVVTLSLPKTALDFTVL